MNSKYTYESVTGAIEIEVDESWAAILAAEDEAERKAERRHRRHDHKYAPGAPLSIDGLLYEGEWLAGSDNSISMVEVSVDLEKALQMLTSLQRRYFILNQIEGLSYAEIARLDGKDEATIRKHLKLALVVMKNFVS